MYMLHLNFCLSTTLLPAHTNVASSTVVSFKMGRFERVDIQIYIILFVVVRQEACTYTQEEILNKKKLSSL